MTTSEMISDQSVILKCQFDRFQGVTDEFWCDNWNEQEEYDQKKRKNGKH